MALTDDIKVEVGRNRAFEDALDNIRGHVRVEVFGPDGVLKDYRETDNLIVTAGKNQIADRMIGTGVAVPSHMAVGTGTTAAAAGDTTLQTELDRNALTSNTRSANVNTLVGDWAAGDATNAAITEAGILNAATVGTLTARAVFTAIPKGAADTLKITWTLTFG